MLFLILSIGLISNYYNKEKNIDINKDNKINNSIVSMMIQDDNGNYIENNDTSFSLNDYLFNVEKSGCENGGTINWNKEKKKVEASLLTSDKCYAYFDQKPKNTDTILKNASPNTLTENLLGDMYRFYGSEVNNYLCFGTDEKCTTDSIYMYRILGVTPDNEIKVVKYNSIGKYQWNDNNTEEYCGSDGANCIFEKSTLNKGLNGEYFLTNSEYSYLQDEKWLSLIVDKKWNIGDIMTVSDGQLAYTRELNKQTLNYQKIGILSLSDVSFAVEGTKNFSCDDVFSKIFLPMPSNMFLLNFSGLQDDEWHPRGFYTMIYRNGGSDGLSYDNLDDLEDIYPVFYISNNVYLTGCGSIEDPYLINI